MLLPYDATALFELVNDVARYAEFVPGVRCAEVLESDATSMVARLDLEARGRKETLVTANAFPTAERITVALVSGPFRHFEGSWAFDPIGVEGCRVSLRLEFELDNRLVAALMGPFLNRIVDSLVDAFSTRARVLLGT